MTDAREKIAEIIGRTINVEAHTYEVDALDSADAILSALPSIVREMIPDLEWSVSYSGTYEFAKGVSGTQYEAGWDDGAWSQCEGPTMWEWSSGDDHRLLTVGDAKAAANEHHKQQILKAMGMSE